MPAGTFFAPYPYEHLGPHRNQEIVMSELELMLKTATAPWETAAVLIEPVLGEGGYVPAPVPFMKALRAFCDAHDIMLIADEVQSGFGRTGKLFAIEHSGIEPDILIMAKGIASGYPISAIATRAEVSAAQAADGGMGCVGGTYGGNAVACAAAMATLDVFEAEDVVANAEARGEQLRDGLRRVAEAPATQGAIEDVRGWGLMVGCEFDPKLTGLAGRISKLCLEDHQLMLLPTGVREAMRFVPALVVTEAEIDECLGKFEASLAQAVAEQHA